MRVAFIGDMVGRPARYMVGRYLKGIKERYKIDLVIANYENASHGFGLTKKNADELFGYGIDIMTGGNHSWDKKEILDMFESYPLIRPINYPTKSAGSGLIELEVCGERVVIVNVMGSYTMPMCDNPFIKMEEVVSTLRADGVKHIIVDFHAEATSEKQVMMQILKSRVSALVGTHTHVGSDDLAIIDGCCFVTDIGLTGCRDQVIGMDKRVPIERFLTGIGGHFDVPKRCKKILQFILFELDSEGRAIDSKKIKIYDDSDEVIEFNGRFESFL
jgi:metallophosphoesterase (TIGR00282 family)